MVTKTQNNKTDIFKVVPITIKYPQHLLNCLDEIAKNEYRNRSELLRELAADYIQFRKSSLQRE